MPVSAPVSRSPSPAAAPPIAATPGPRAANLIKLYNDAVSHTLKTCNYPNFAACFPTPAQHAPEAMEGFHREFVEKLGEHCREHFDYIIKERNVVPALNDLDRLVDEARNRKAKAEELANGGPVEAPTPPHTLPASSLYMSHLAPSVQTQHKALASQLQAVQVDNAELLTVVAQQRRDIETLVTALETVLTDMDASLASLPPDDMLALTDEVLVVDQHMGQSD